MPTQGLLERSNGHYFQARIPKHCLKQIVREKLPTENHKEVVALVRMRWAELHAEFERIDLRNTKFKTSISPSEVEHIINVSSSI